MKSPLAALAIGAALLAIPAATRADDQAMAPMKPAAMDATMLCRPATATEKPTAMMGTQGIVCKSMDKMMKDGMMMVPDTKSASDKAWRTWLDSALLIPVSAGGNG
jgi:hypothetical protein